MASRRKQFERRAGSVAFSLAERSFARKDPLAAERAGTRLGMLVYRLSKKHRLRALSNLELAMPELDERARIDLVKRCFQHFGIVMADFMRGTRRPEEEVQKICTPIDLHHLEAALEKGKGAILITGHFGNWELASHFITLAGYKLTVVARDANDSDMNQAVTRIRLKHGVEVLSRGNAARGILKTLGRNEMVGILPDQNSTDLFVPFFGKPCGTVIGPATIHVRTGAPLVPVFCRRVGPDRYEVRAYPPIEATPGFDPVEGYTRAMNDALERVIRESPEQWLWFHDRWKSARKAGLL